MKELLIARHAKSSWKNTELLDIERPLNKRGYNDANAIGRYLKLNKVNPDLILTSPAVRAFSTATIYARNINFNYDNFKVVEELYSASLYDIEDIIKNLSQEIKSVMIFGHNPTFTDLANYFSNSNLENLPTSGVISIKFNVANWHEIADEKGKVTFYQYPKKLAL